MTRSSRSSWYRTPIPLLVCRELVKELVICNDDTKRRFPNLPYLALISHLRRLTITASSSLPAQAFKPNEVDLPTSGTVAPHNAITLPDNYNNIDFLEESFSAE